MKAPSKTPVKAAIVVASDRAASGEYDDQTGPIIAAALREGGFTCDEPVVVPDGDPVARAIRDAVAGGARVVLTTGGTGLAPTDHTPEVTAGLLDFEVPGIAEAVRLAGLTKGVGTAALSRGVAGVIGSCLVINLPGSKGGVRDGLGVVLPLLDHAISQLDGGDH